MVGVVYSAETLLAARALGDPPAAPDWLELRVDAFADEPGGLDALAASSPRPLIVTVRGPAEGGLRAGLDERRRRELYARFLPIAAAVDVEARGGGTLDFVVAAARRADCEVIASFHDFAGTPPLVELQAAAARAAAAGAGVFKAATTVETPADLATLFALLHPPSAIPLAVMGMGRLGRASRPALAAAGSVLNYGFLGATAQVPGQWPVDELRARIDELA